VALWGAERIIEISEKSGAPGIDDNELVAQVLAQQDSAAFGELVRRHQSQVRNFLRKLTRDLVLLKVAYTTFLQSKRKSSRYSEILEEVGHDAETRGGQQMQQSEDVLNLDKFLAVLTEDERAVMILSYACGLSHREIGDAANMPIGTVKSIIFRGKEKIRESFDIEDHKYG
jgi:RNA polymerase sigma-70 factor (ECF subfamily)